MENNEQQFENQIENSIYKNNLFILGSFEKRITVYSQQVRSINLVYSLYKVYNFNLNTRIGIIGGGAAGITAAISAARLGATVHLYEKSSILNLWSQCKVRKIHPNIF
ncbi:MAG: FAD-dependent oxidoreductase, partial [Saprospiraceae bacterium]|nr:FAD-dependent oxidoreductase [Saprospiraceae bacterium]